MPSEGDGRLWQVSIDLGRVQTFLFAVPRLRDMLGANALLGGVMRVELPRIARDCGAKGPPGVDRLRSSHPDFFARPSSDDPLGKCGEVSDRDEPVEMLKQGILRREGGHFAAIFPTDDAAKAFEREAERYIVDSLPGLAFTISHHVFGTEPEPRRTRPAYALPDLPVFQVCEAAGIGPATELSEYRASAQQLKIEPISRPVADRRVAYKCFKDKRSKDVIGLLRSSISNPLPLSDREPAQDFESLCGGDYLAVIHADGNRVGLRFKRLHEETAAALDQLNLPPLDRAILLAAAEECFYYTMRVAVRTSLVVALKEVFESVPDDAPPYQLLMLGGDDMLLICRARHAFEFVRAYAQGLKDTANGLTVAAGIAIASPSFPFHRLHALADSLASSAKRLHRSALQCNEETSVVDWLICTESWSDDPIGQRRRDEYVRYLTCGKEEQLALTCRPYRILGGKDSLQALLDDARNFQNAPSDEAHAARSQLRHLASELRHGRLRGELVFASLPKGTRDKLTAIGITEPWKSVSDGFWTTPIRDLVEIQEVPKLQRRLPGQAESAP